MISVAQDILPADHNYRLSAILEADDSSNSDYRTTYTNLESKTETVLRKPLIYSSLNGNQFYLHVSKPLIDLNRVYFPKRTKFFIPSYSNAADYQLPQYDRHKDNQRDNNLGSGNFGVLRGGTFYPLEEVENRHQSTYFNYGLHSESSAIEESCEENQAKEKTDLDHDNDQSIEKETTYNNAELFAEPTYTRSEEQFEHFRDFADLTTGTEVESQSELFVIYAPNFNQSRRSTAIRNKKMPIKWRPIRQTKHHYAANILEKLQEIDCEQEVENKRTKLTKIKNKFKTSKLKGLQKKQLFRKDEHQAKEVDPLLADY